jgi:outer membrane protein TolC
VQRGDVVAAQVNLGSDRINLEMQRARVATSRADLLAALGRSPSESIELVAPAEVDGEVSSTGPASLEALLERALAKRPLLARYRGLAEQAALDKRIAGADWWPTVAAGASYDRSGPNFAGEQGVWGDPTRQYVATAQLLLQWNLFNGRLTQAAEQRAELAERQVALQAELAIRQVQDEVARARASLAALESAEALARQNLEAAGEGVRLAKERLEAGAASQLELRDASLKLTQAKLAVVNARIDRLVARAELARAVGGELP